MLKQFPSFTGTRLLISNPHSIMEGNARMLALCLRCVNVVFRALVKKFPAQTEFLLDPVSRNVAILDRELDHECGA